MYEYNVDIFFFLKMLFTFSPESWIFFLLHAIHLDFGLEMDDAFELGQAYCLPYPKSVTVASGYFEGNGLVPIAQSFLGGAGCHWGIPRASVTLN